MKTTRQMEINLQDKLKKIREVKTEEYGPFSSNMNSIGMMWSALLGLKNPIPGWLVSLMYVAAKIIRAKHKYKTDNFIDAEIYLHQAKLMQEEQQKK